MTVETEWQDWDAPWEKEAETIETATAWHRNKLEYASAKKEDDICEQSQRRNGYGYSAIQLFIDYLKQYYEEIYTQTWSGNERMIGLANKLGFKECNRLKDKRIVNGKHYDALTFMLGE